MSEDFHATLDRIDPRGGELTPGFAARLVLNGRHVAEVESDGLGGPPILQWLDPRGRDADLLRLWRDHCDAEAERIYQETLGGHFPVSRGHDGVDWAAEELTVFALYEATVAAEVAEHRTAKEHWQRAGRKPL